METYSSWAAAECRGSKCAGCFCTRSGFTLPKALSSLTVTHTVLSGGRVMGEGKREVVLLSTEVCEGQ